MCSNRFPHFFLFWSLGSKNSHKLQYKGHPIEAIYDDRLSSDCSQFMSTRSGDNTRELCSFDLVPHFEECTPWNVIVSSLLRTSWNISYFIFFETSLNSWWFELVKMGIELLCNEMSCLFIHGLNCFVWFKCST